MVSIKKCDKCESIDNVITYKYYNGIESDGNRYCNDYNYYNLCLDCLLKHIYRLQDKFEKINSAEL